MDEAGSQVLQQVLFFGLLLLGFYLLAIRPQRARARAMAAVRAGLEVGSRVVTTAGIHGTVVALGEGAGGDPGLADPGLADPELADTVLLEVAPGVRVRFATPAVIRVLGGAAGPAGGATERA